MIRYITCSITLLVSIICYSKDKNVFYKVYLGEQNFEEYYGPVDPIYKFDEYKNKISFDKDERDEKYFHRLTTYHFYNLINSSLNILPKQFSCPNTYLGENIPYIRYLFRLITISYLIESIRDYKKTLYQLRLKSNSCKTSYKDIFSKCNPKTQDMKLYISRLKQTIDKNFKLNAFYKKNNKEINKWIKTFKKDYNKKNVRDMAWSSIKNWCGINNIKCNGISLKSIEEALNYSCNRDARLIRNLCSENDYLYGISYSKQPKLLLLQSNIMTLINKLGYGKSCLNRYIELFKHKEIKYPYLVEIFSVISRKLLFNNARYIQGENFIPGALKEFDNKGLTEFLYTPKKEKPKLKPKPIIKPIPKPKPIIVVEKPKPTTVKPIPKPKPKPKPVILSAFETAVLKRTKENLDKVNVDMKKFKKDFKLSSAIKDIFNESLKDFQTRQALTDMRDQDGLGSITEPIRLIFLKYLIEVESHKGLWNIISVIGKNFYVINDIEKKKNKILINLMNDKSTDHNWQISIIKPKENKNPKK